MKKSLFSWASLSALGALVVFQGLILVLWPGGPPWGLVLGGLGLDLTLGTVLWWALTQGHSEDSKRWATHDHAAQECLALAKTQTIAWLSSLAEMEGLTEEREPLLAELAVVRKLETVSGIDALQTLLLLNYLVDQRRELILSLQRSTSEQRHGVLLSHRLNHYRLKQAVEFLTSMGGESSRYSEKIVLEVLQTFREITQFSHGIGTEVADKVRHLMDPGNAEGLDAIHKESSRIQHSVEELIGELSRANGYTEKAVLDNLDRMQRVQDMAGAIGEFSESIRMISLNLNIEAARATQRTAGNGRSFQVLAAKLSEFATRAGELARQQQEAIATALSVVTESGRVQREKNLALMAQVSPIKSRLEPFSRIVDQTFHEFELVETSMSQLSVSIEARLKSVLGQFQFQDLVRQEQEHILAMFAHIRDLAAEHEGSVFLDEGQKLLAWKDLIVRFERIATTENERMHIQMSRNETSVPISEEEDSRLEAGSVALF